MQSFIKKTAVVSLIINLLCPLTIIAAPLNYEEEPVDLNEWIYVYNDLEYPPEDEVEDGYAHYEKFDYENSTPTTENAIAQNGFFGATITNKFYKNKYGIIPGVMIEEIVPNGPARRAGLRRGDFITEFNGFKIRGIADFLEELSNTVPGQKVVITISNPQMDLSYKSEDYIVELESYR